MADIITTIKDPEDIHFILKRKEIKAENVIILTKGDIHGLLNVEREGYTIKFLEGDFFEILQDIKCVFDIAPEPCFIAGENELDIYVTYYLAQLEKTIPFYVFDNYKLISLPVSTSHAFTHVKKQIMEYLNEHEQSNPDEVVNHLSRESGARGRKDRYSKLTINQYLHELKSADLVNSEGNRYSLNDKGFKFMEILK
jgi:hypothetical protein